MLAQLHFALYANCKKVVVDQGLLTDGRNWDGHYEQQIMSKVILSYYHMKFDSWYDTPVGLFMTWRYFWMLTTIEIAPDWF